MDRVQIPPMIKTCIKVPTIAATLNSKLNSKPNVAVATHMSNFKEIGQDLHFSRLHFNKVIESPEISLHVNFYMSFLPAMC
jgi:hypothetical protein